MVARGQVVGANRYALLVAVLALVVGAGGAAAQTVVASGLSTPSGLTRDDNGDLLIGSSWVSAIAVLPFAGGPAHTVGPALNGPQKILRGPDGALYIGIYSDNVVRRSIDGGLTSTVYATGITQPIGMAFGGDGALYVASYTPRRIMRVAPGGGVATEFANPGHRPQGMVALPNGDLLVAVPLTASLVRITVPGGVVSTYATGLSGPTDLAVDGAGVVYVSNASGDVQRVASDGTPTTILTASTPSGLAFNRAGDLFVVESFSNQIRRYNAMGAPVPAIVPTLSEWAMMLFGLLMAGFAAWRLRSTRAA